MPLHLAPVILRYFFNIYLFCASWTPRGERNIYVITWDWSPEDNTWESVLSFCHASPRIEFRSSGLTRALACWAVSPAMPLVLNFSQWFSHRYVKQVWACWVRKTRLYSKDPKCKNHGPLLGHTCLPGMLYLTEYHIQDFLTLSQILILNKQTIAITRITGRKTRDNQIENQRQSLGSTHRCH